MNDFLEEFLCSYENDICGMKSVGKTNDEIDTYERQLRQTLSKKQRKLLLDLGMKEDY